MLQENININEVFAPAKNGINNALAYSAIVLNKKNKIEISSLYIDEQYRMITPEVNQETLIDSFRDFVVYNALCNMMENFEITLDRAYRAFLPIVNTGKNYTKSTYKENVKKFSYLSFEEKLEIIKKYINNTDENEKLWVNLKHVRNCITHNGSIVQKEDIKLLIPSFSMKYIDLVTKEEFYSNSEDLTITMGKVKGNEGKLIIDLSCNEKIFKHGEIIKFTDREIISLIRAMRISIETLNKEFMYLLLDNGRSINCDNGMTITKREELDKIWEENSKPLRIELHQINKEKNSG